MSFLGVGAGEALLVFIIALIVIGPHRFPEAMRSAGRWYRIARTYSSEVMKDVRAAVDDIEREVNAETEDLKSVRELTDLSDITEELRDTERVAQDVARGTETVLREGSEAAPATSAATPATDTTPRPIRPSQRTSGETAATDTSEQTAPQTLDPFKRDRNANRTRRPRTEAASAASDIEEPSTTAEREDDRA